MHLVLLILQIELINVGRESFAAVWSIKFAFADISPRGDFDDGEESPLLLHWMWQSFSSMMRNVIRLFYILYNIYSMPEHHTLCNDDCTSTLIISHMTE